MPEYYYITGPDGSGKTTYGKLIEQHYKRLNYKVKKIWIRSPKILSKPLMAYCRVVGLTKYRYINGIRYGGHGFYRSRFVSWIFPVLQLIDFKIKWYFVKKTIENEFDYIIFDRFVFDTLADLMVDTERYDLHKIKIGKIFLNQLPDNTKTVVLLADEHTIRQRKEDTRYDHLLGKKLKVYKILARDLDLKIIDNNFNLEVVRNNIFNQLEIYGRNKSKN